MSRMLKRPTQSAEQRRRFTDGRRLGVVGIVLTVTMVLSGCSLLSTVGIGGAGASDDAARSKASSSAQATPRPTAIILDASGSMTATDAPGERFAAAQKAVNALVETIPEGQETSLLTYGTKTGSSDDEKAAGCQDVTTVIDASPIDKRAFTTAVDGLKPSGYTPIALALKTAAEQLPSSGERSIVLLSDGIDTCADGNGQTDPCTTARNLGADGDLAIHTVGFRVDDKASQQLECLSEETNGTSWDAVNDKQLAARLSLAINPGLAYNLLFPSGYRGLELGMTIDEAKGVAGFTDEVSAHGRVEIVYVDCTLVFVDGVLKEMSTEGVPTLERIKPGDDIAEAESAYGDPDRPPDITDDGAVIFPAGTTDRTGYKIYFDSGGNAQPGQKLSGTITKVVLCKCAAKPGSTPSSSNPTSTPSESTQVKTFKPFTPDGQIRPEIKNENRTDLPAVPVYDEPSPSGVSPDTYFLGSTADSMSACWQDTDDEAEAICLRNPWSDETFTRTLDGSLPGTFAAADPVLWAMELEDGSRWQLRTGGSWAGRPDGWFAAYGCLENCQSIGDTWPVILANDEFPNGYDASSTNWTAFVGEVGTDDPAEPEEVPITEGWFVG
jgi:uncharacterized protein YceK